MKESALIESKGCRTAGMVEIAFPSGETRLVPAGTTLLELGVEYESACKSTIVAAKVDNEIRDLNFRIEDDCLIEFIDLTHSDGFRIYQRSICFVLIKAVLDLFPERKVVIQHSISKGLYCDVRGDAGLTGDDVIKIEKRMRELVEAKIPFMKKVMPTEEAEDALLKAGRIDRYHLIEDRMKPYVTVYSCDGFEDYFYGYMVPHTGYVDKFALRYYPPGLILLYPERSNPGVVPRFEEQKKLFSVFSEFKRWNRILGVENVGALNDIIKAGKINDFIRISEALHEKKIAGIADMIAANSPQKRIILISGPSSSGKTTFAQRLSIQLKVNGITPVTISLDDYFVDRDRTPLDENGEADFEALEAIDVELFNMHLNDLIRGKEVDVPVFDFQKGCRSDESRKLRINEGDVVLIEGIHGLNPALTPLVPEQSKFRIYVSALTSMNIDDHNRIPTTDTRIIRRIVRDNMFRGSSALATLKRWPSVRRGEKTNIFPYQEEADIMFNSALIYELGVLKAFAEPLLKEIDRTQPEYSEAKRLIGFLSYFLPIEPSEIPLNSIIREFIGGCCFM